MTRVVFRPFPVLLLTSLLAFVFLIGLGRWQLDRLHWKLDLIDKLEARPKAEPVALDRLWSGRVEDLDAIEFRPVTVTGRFDHAREMHHYGNAGVGQPGYFVITPLLREDRAPVLVNRGFVPAALRDPVRRADGQVEGPVTLTGLVRAPGTKGRFVPSNDPDANLWYWRDIEAMVASAGIDGAPPLYLDATQEATPPGGWPRAGTTVPKLSNNHLGYALSWFGMAACLVLIVIQYHVAHGRLGFARESRGEGE